MQLITALTRAAEAPISSRELIQKYVQGSAVVWENIFTQGTQLSVITANKGMQFTATVLGLMITDYCKCFNVVRPMSDEQIADLAIDITLDYWHYRLEDFAAFFQLCKKSVFGIVRDRIDYGTIMEMLAKYEGQRSEALYRRQIDRTEHELPAERKTEAGNEVVSLAGAVGEFKILAREEQKKIDALHPANKKPDEHSKG